MATVLNDNICPLTPNSLAASGTPASPDPTPLVTVTQYQKATGDALSESEDITDALAEAVIIASEYCRRTFTYGQYTESQYLYANGMVYPSATPIDVTQVINANVEGKNNIYDPNDPGTDPASSIIQGQGVWVGWFSPLPWMPFYTGVVPPQTILTYWGGYRNPDVAGIGQAAVPPTLKRIFCRIAFKILNPVSLQGQPQGTKASSVGGVSVTGDLSAFGVLDPQLKRDLRRWRHPQAYAWQA